MNKQEIIQWGIDMSQKIKENKITALKQIKIGRRTFIVLTDSKYKTL